ncbi:PPP1R27 [Bugula neritina]|uniref:PPP1R27 n=1 Tax=Bugula neritina TaxID=10212 RepID=A0A7J7KAM1_BUGNE|nr:PPP1R27 [Bugula neritina]
MSRRASVYKRQNPGKPRVKFSDELVLQDCVKENDIEEMHHMLRRASLQVDLSAINSAGLTALHQAVLDGNFKAVRLLLKHGADVNKVDEDSWTPLHAACAEGQADIARYLLKQGADPSILTDDGERPIDLCDHTDMPTIRVLLRAQSSDIAVSDDAADNDDDDTITEEDYK